MYELRQSRVYTYRGVLHTIGSTLKAQWAYAPPCCAQAAGALALLLALSVTQSLLQLANNIISRPINKFVTCVNVMKYLTTRFDNWHVKAIF